MVAISIGVHYRRAAEIVAQILSGRKPADIPVDFTDRFYVTVDPGRAKAIGLEIPASLLLRANVVIQSPAA